MLHRECGAGAAPLDAPLDLGHPHSSCWWQVLSSREVTVAFSIAIAP